MIRSQFWTSAALVLAIAPACGDDTGSATTSELTTGTSTTGEPEPTGSGSGSTTEAPVPFEPIPALGGIELDWVEANQGIGVAIGRDGAGVGGADRTSYLLQNRLTLVRAFWKSLPPDWVPRKIEGRLIISGYPDGDKVLSHVAEVDGESFIGNLSKSFYWGLMPEEVIPGLKFRVELWETKSGWELISDSLPEPGANPPNLPLSGSAFIGVEDSLQTMKVTFVPFNYNYGGCNTTVDTSPEVMQKFHDYMFMMNPIERLDITVRQPYTWQGELSYFGEIHQVLLDMRQQDAAPPETYYYGIVNVCSGGLGGAGGQAIDIPNSSLKSDAWKRTSAGLWLPGNEEWSYETFVHEVGHSQGRYHIACSGEAGTDNTYPHQGGDIGDWGFGVVNFKLYHPTVHKDYMTYCHPTWASTFGWNKVYPVIRELSSWEMQGQPAPEPPIGSILLGVVYPDGKELWTTTPGAVDENNRSAVHSVEFWAGGQPIAIEAAEVRPQPDSDAVNIIVPLPAGFDDVSHIVRSDGELRTTVQAAKIRQPAKALKNRP